jgi:hypothetical protein
MRGVDPVEAQTIVTPPVGSYDEDTGHLAVRVVDRGGQPVDGVQVSIAGPDPQSQFTSSDGCVFFGFLTPGSYTATASATGYVSDQGATSPAQSVAVVSGAIASLLFLYDRAATLNLTLVGKDAGSAAPAAVYVTLFNTSILPSGLLPKAGSGSPRQVTGLFPFSAGYSVWAGRCADADPAFYPGGARPDPATVDPGTTTDETVLMPEITVTVTVAGVPSANRTIAATHASATGCTGGESFTIGTTNSSGQLTFALPYGTWQVKVDNVVRWTGTLSPNDPAGPKPVTVAL